MGEGLQRAARAARRTRYPGTPEPAIGQVWASVANPSREVTIKGFGTVRRHGVDKCAATCAVTVGGKPRQGTAIDCDLLVPTAKGYRYLRPMGATGLTCAARGGPVTMWLGTPPPGWKPVLRPPCLACGAGCADDCAGAAPAAKLAPSPLETAEALAQRLDRDAGPGNVRPLDAIVADREVVAATLDAAGLRDAANLVRGAS